MSYTKTNTFFSTLSVVLVLFGYAFVTTLFGTAIDSGNSRMVTVPFRLLSLSVLIITWYLNRNTRSNSSSLRILWIYWVLLLIRMFFDLFIRADIPPIGSDQRNVLVLLTLSEAFIPAIVFSKCYKYIDFDKLLTWGFVLTTATVVIAMFINTSAFLTGDVDGERLTANVALNSISTGMLGMQAIIVAVTILRKRRTSFVIRLLIYFIIVLDFIFTLRAGSRGPLLSGLVVMFFATLSATKNKTMNLIILLIVGVILWLSMGFLENFVNDISPVLYNRLYGKSVEEQLYGRDDLYKLAFSYFLESPVLGKYFALYLGGNIVWVHNILIESLLQLGIIGFTLILTIIVKSCRKVLSLGESKVGYFWLALLLISCITGGMVSSVFCTSSISPLYALLFTPIDSRNISIQKQKQAQ